MTPVQKTLMNRQKFLLMRLVLFLYVSHKARYLSLGLKMIVADLVITTDDVRNELSKLNNFDKKVPKNWLRLCKSVNDPLACARTIVRAAIDRANKVRSMITIQ